MSVLIKGSLFMKSIALVMDKKHDMIAVSLKARLSCNSCLVILIHKRMNDCSREHGDW